MEKAKSIIYKTILNYEYPVSFIDAEQYGDYINRSRIRGEDYDETEIMPISRLNDNKTIENLDLENIINFIEEEMSSVGIKIKPRGFTGILNQFFIPVYDIDEIKKRQGIVREIYEDADIRNKLPEIIKSLKKINYWSPKYLEKTVGKSSERIREIEELVNAVDTIMSINPKSEYLHSVKEFAEMIHTKTEYKKIKIYVSKCGQQLLNTYEDALKKVKIIWGYDYGSFTSIELSSVFASLARKEKFTNKLDLTDASLRRNIYSSLLDLKEVVNKLLHDPELRHLIEEKEVKLFKLEERLDEGLNELSNLAEINYDDKNKVSKAKRFFFKQFGELLYHLDLIINKEVETNMSKLEIKSNNLETELAFYYSLSGLAHKMQEKHKIVMPTILEKEKRYFKIDNASIPSFLLRRYKVVDNNVFSSPECHVQIITGPNDNGKTSYERMIGQNQILFQLGSFVPAEFAEMSIVDAIFTFFGSKDNPKEKEGKFKSGISFLEYITNPQCRAEQKKEYLSKSEINYQLNNSRISFFTPYSLILLDEIGIGSDDKVPGIVIDRAIKAALGRGTRILISTHYHPLVEEVMKGKYPNTRVLGAVTENGKNTFKMVPNRHEPSFGEIIIAETGYTEENISKSNDLFKQIKY
jgi:DNA mismatch repair ATPase MutS